MSQFVEYANAVTIADALQLAFWTWLGFSVTQTIGGVLWEMKKLSWFVVCASYNLVIFGIGAVILTMWR